MGGVLTDAFGAGTVAAALAFWPILLRYLDSRHIALIVVCALVGGVLISAKGRKVTVGLARRVRRRLARQWSVRPPDAVEPGASTYDDIRLLRQFVVDAVGFTVRVRPEVQIRADALVLSRFKELNAIRESRNLVPYYDAVRFLPVGLPEWVAQEHRFVVEAVRVDYAVAALILDPSAAADGRRACLALLEQVDGVAPYLRQHWRRGSLGLLGVQVCLVTSDLRLLLRRRGASVLFAIDRWDVSVSGFAGSADQLAGAHVDVTRTVESETYREIGHLRADPRAIRLLGVTHNRVTGAYDVLACWKLDADVNDLLSLLIRRRAREGHVFDTEIKAIERYVWDSRNLIVRLDRCDVATAWRECGISEADFEPQSLLCIDRAFDLLVGPGRPGVPLSA
jgi:hypothetical protein